jgi:hypothetical protein
VSFPSLYGANAGSHNLTGKTNAQVASFLQSFFSPPSLSTLDAEILVTALNVYASTQSLGGTAGQAYGFKVDAYGLGADSYNVGVLGAPFGVANNTQLNVYELLQAANQATVGGVSWNNQMLLHMEALLVFMSTNEFGSIH